MRSLPIIGLSLAAAVLVGACSSGAASPAASPSGPAASPSGAAASPAASAVPSAAAGIPSIADLDGHVFIVTGAAGYVLVPDTEVTLTFQDGHLGVSAGCNQMSGGYDIQDGKLVIGPMMSTEMACADPLMAQDTWISTFLPGAAVTLEGHTLTLSKDGVTLTATDKTVARPDLPIEGTTWVVDGLVANQAVSSMPQGVTATLVFADGKVAVDTGCNTGSGAAEIGDTAIAFGPIATTRMACEGSAGAVEAAVLAVLVGDVAYTIDADALQLRGAGGGLDLRAKP